MLVKQSKIGSINNSQMGKQLFQWIGFKETLQETPIFDGENPWFPVKIFPTKPIQWLFAKREENTNSHQLQKLKCQKDQEAQRRRHGKMQHLGSEKRATIWGFKP